MVTKYFIILVALIGPIVIEQWVIKIWLVEKRPISSKVAVDFTSHQTALFSPLSTAYTFIIITITNHLSLDDIIRCSLVRRSESAEANRKLIDYQTSRCRSSWLNWHHYYHRTSICDQIKPTSSTHYYW